MAMETIASPQGPVRVFTTRCGHKVELVAVLGECRAVNSGGQIIGILRSAISDGLIAWRKNGRYLELGEHDWDLVDLPLHWLQPTIPPFIVGPQKNLGTDVVSTCGAIIRGAEDMIARARLTMRPFEKTRVVAGAQHYRAGGSGSGPGYIVCETHGVGLGTDLSGQQPEGHAHAGNPDWQKNQGVAALGSYAWVPAGDKIDWRKEPLLTEEVGRMVEAMDGRHKLLDELLRPVMKALKDEPRTTLVPTTSNLILTALREAGFGETKVTTSPRQAAQ